MQIFDVSVPLRPGIPVWPGDPELEVELAAAIADGAEVNVTRLALSAHTGTHVDAPVHYHDGAPGVDELPLDALVGSCLVVDARAVEGELQPDILPPPGCERVLFKTSAGVALSAEAAAEVVRRGIRLVGIDELTIGGAEAHRILLAAGVVPLEGLDLRAVEPGEYTVVSLPLKLAGADGAPARTVLLRD